MKLVSTVILAGLAAVGAQELSVCFVEAKTHTLSYLAKSKQQQTQRNKAATIKSNNNNKKTKQKIQRGPELVCWYYEEDKRGYE